MPKAQIAKWGNSLAVRIPKAVAEEARLQEGDAILIEVSKGHVELRPAERIPTLEKLVAQITPENRHEATDWGLTSGRKSWNGNAVRARCGRYCMAELRSAGGP